MALRAFRAGRAPAPPVARLTGHQIVGASVGSATYALRATDWMPGPKGVVHSGALALLADGALIASVISALPARVFCATAELSLTFLGTPPSTGGDLTAHARLLHLDAETGLAEVHVCDARNRLVAQGASRCAVFPPIDDSIQLLQPAEPAAADPGPTIPDPHLRTPPATDQLTSIRLLRAERGQVALTLPAGTWLGNEWGTVYGGVLALLAKSSVAAAEQTTADPGTGFAPLDINVNFLRVVPADGRELRATGTVLHRGTRLAIANAEVLHGEHRVAVLTGTTELRPLAALRSTLRTKTSHHLQRSPSQFA